MNRPGSSLAGFAVQIILLIGFVALSFLTYAAHSIKDKQDEDDKALLWILLFSSVLLAVAILWNGSYFLEYKSSGYKGDIFRNFVRTSHAPVYGHGGWALVPWLIIPIGVVALWLARSKLEMGPTSRFRTVEVSIWSITLIIAFALSDGPQRFLEMIFRQVTFARCADVFCSIPDIFINYIQWLERELHSPQRSICQHYPPGNLIVILLTSPWGNALGFKLFVIGCSVLSLPLLGSIAKNLGLTGETAYRAQLFFMWSPAVLILSSVSLTPISMFLSTGALLALVIALKRSSWPSSIALGFLMFLSGMISFTVVILALLMVGIVLSAVALKIVKLSTALRTAVISLATFTISFYLLKLAFGFDILRCLELSMQENTMDMADGFDDPVRYLVRSSGNILAYLIVAGFAQSALAFQCIWKRLRQHENSLLDAFALAVPATMLIAAFSGLFFLETERIWLFFSPCWMILAASGLSTKTRSSSVRAILAFSAVLALGQELVFDHFS